MSFIIFGRFRVFRWLFNFAKIFPNNFSLSFLVLKDEPDDLTHLAPTAGDACIPLDETAPFFSDMFDDFIIPDNYNAMLTDELNSLDSTCSKTTSNSSSNDPFINYRDDSNDICHSPHLLSPGLSKVISSEVVSLCPPTRIEIQSS